VDMKEVMKSLRSAVMRPKQTVLTIKRRNNFMKLFYCENNQGESALIEAYSIHDISSLKWPHVRFLRLVA
jgi:hypothetical protein